MYVTYTTIVVGRKCQMYLTFIPPYTYQTKFTQATWCYGL